MLEKIIEQINNPESSHKKRFKKDMDDLINDCLIYIDENKKQDNKKDRQIKNWFIETLSTCQIAIANLENNLDLKISLNNKQNSLTRRTTSRNEEDMEKTKKLMEETKSLMEEIYSHL